MRYPCGQCYQQINAGRVKQDPAGTDRIFRRGRNTLPFSRGGNVPTTSSNRRSRRSPRSRASRIRNGRNRRSRSATRRFARQDVASRRSPCRRRRTSPGSRRTTLPHRGRFDGSAWYSAKADPLPDRWPKPTLRPPATTTRQRFPASVTPYSDAPASKLASCAPFWRVSSTRAALDTSTLALLQQTA